MYWWEQTSTPNMGMMFKKRGAVCGKFDTITSMNIKILNWIKWSDNICIIYTYIRRPRPTQGGARKGRRGTALLLLLLLLLAATAAAAAPSSQHRETYSKLFPRRFQKGRSGPGKRLFWTPFVLQRHGVSPSGRAVSLWAQQQQQ